ncbi:hypothetical protein GJ496_001251 [Pomphorhynchus laevis]|nr:hypothetical protein GJ496_001251 [Pomphorhynchus laevis]
MHIFRAKKRSVSWQPSSNVSHRRTVRRNQMEDYSDRSVLTQLHCEVEILRNSLALKKHEDQRNQKYYHRVQKVVKNKTANNYRYICAFNNNCDFCSKISEHYVETHKDAGVDTYDLPIETNRSGYNIESFALKTDSSFSNSSLASSIASLHGVLNVLQTLRKDMEHIVSTVY